jgi:hypothetical protein
MQGSGKSLSPPIIGGAALRLFAACMYGGAAMLARMFSADRRTDFLQKRKNLLV